MCNTTSLMNIFSLFFQLYGIRDVLSEHVNGCVIQQMYRVASANSTHPLSF